jgi:hypothetical protein
MSLENGPGSNHRGDGGGARDLDQLGRRIEVIPSTPPTTTATSPVHPSRGGAISRADYLLAELRCAALRARLVQADIEAIGIALKAGLISADQAAELLAEVDLLRLIGIPMEEPRAK